MSGCADFQIPGGAPSMQKINIAAPHAASV